MSSDLKSPWRVLAKSERYDNGWMRVTHHDVLTPAGDPGIYGVVHFKHLAVGVVPLDADGCTYLVGQYRFPLDRYSWEIPEGGGIMGVDARVSAERELQEETGLRAAQWMKLLECDLSNCLTDERAVLFLAWDLTKGTATPEPTEQLQVRRVPLVDAFSMVADGTIRDAMSILALQAVALLWKDGRLPDVGLLDGDQLPANKSTKQSQ